jgi:ribosomal protein L12E/L44/L45/RPP1/RPP2
MQDIVELRGHEINLDELISEASGAQAASTPSGAQAASTPSAPSGGIATAPAPQACTSMQ